MAGMNNYSQIMYSNKRQSQRASRRHMEELSNQDFSTTDNKLQQVHQQGGGGSGTQLHKSQLHFTFEDDRNVFMDPLGSVSDNYFKYASSGGDLSMPLEKSKMIDNYYEEDEISIRRYLGVGVQWISLLTENLLCHPFIVLRRQCQVFHASERYHLHPFGLVPTVIHLYRRQGITTMWKGLGSCLLVRGISMAVDDVISKVTSWPKEVNNRTSFRRFGQHVILKCVSIAVVMPFYAASLVETVQSDIASEKPGVFDVFREGSLRLMFWSSPQKGRMLPVWALVVPSVSLGITKYLFGLIIKGISQRIIRRRIQQTQELRGAKFKDDSLENQNVEIYSNLVSMITTEMIFYPFETILHRIQLQGTRTIIDNLDTGYAVVPILTNYQGAFDCYRTTIASEGLCGLYKGFGAVVLQFAAHVAVIKLTKWVVTQITEILSNRPSNKIIQYYNLARDTQSSSATLSRSISLGSDLDMNSIGNHSVD